MVEFNGPPLVGRILQRGLSDEAGDRHYLLVDATDGRVHYVDIGRAGALETLPEGAIVRLSRTSAEARPADRTVAEIAAANGGRYSEALHRQAHPEATAEHVRAHGRRLEAIRRSLGGIERSADGSWQLGADHLERSERFEAIRARDATARVEVFSALPLEALPQTEGATWLDRELLADTPQPLREAGFGAEVQSAIVARRAWLVEQGLAEETGDGPRLRRGLLALLRQRELARIGEQLAGEFGLPAREAARGEEVAGVLRRRIDLVSGRFALLEGSSELVLVPWRRDLERQIGRQLSGRVGPTGLSWSRGRARGIEIG